MCGLSVGLSDTFEFVVLLDYVAVGGTLSGVDELVTEALSNTLMLRKSASRTPVQISQIALE